MHFEQVMTWILLIGTLLSIWFLRFNLLSLEHRIAMIQFKVGEAVRCPVCGHPVITGHFNEGERFTCLECGEQFIWRLKDGCYQLTRQEDKKSC